ncbi:LysR family transcriptional regulator [Acidimangrovimonas sediminis]|uniref:LysR family transcriptional regulator n=1 Tax=Acidimangrovimonas sediminis TaxID=2056283 RepID=UPI000C808D24|nr:LysR substrate-binding domain-containing protein [Acidimangrovimonas sediminis]
MPVPLDSDLMRSFLAVAEAGSVTEAAGRLGRTQSAVSMQIRRLEDLLGQPLFERQPRGVALTDRGARLLPYARRVSELLDEAAAALSERPLSGPVRVGIPEEYGERVLPGVLAAFAERHPAAEVTVRVDFSAPQLRALASGELDLAVTFAEGKEGPGEVLGVDPTVWATSLAHGQHLQRPLPIAAFFRSDWCRDYAEGSLRRQRIAYRVAWTCDTAGGMERAVRAGLAVAPLSRSSMPDGCRELTAEDGFPPIDSSAIVLHRNPRSTTPAVEGMIEMLREAFQPFAGARP